MLSRFSGTVWKVNWWGIYCRCLAAQRHLWPPLAEAPVLCIHRGQFFSAAAVDGLGQLSTVKLNYYPSLTQVEDNLDLLKYTIKFASPYASFGDMLSAHLEVVGRVRLAYRFKGMRQVWFFDLEDLDDKDPARTSTAIWDCTDDPSAEKFSQCYVLKSCPIARMSR